MIFEVSFTYNHSVGFGYVAQCHDTVNLEIMG
jgi:hypothetical protein